MSKRLLICLIGAWISFLSGNPITVLSEDPAYLILEFNLPDYQINEVEEQGDLYSRIDCPSGIPLLKPGYPLLPYFSELVGIPPEGDISIQILDQQHKLMNNILIYPVAESIDHETYYTTEFSRNEKAYSSRSPYPENIVENGENACMRDRCFSSIRINPYQYIAGKRELMITTYLKLKIIIEGDVSLRGSWNSADNFIDDIGDDFFLNNNSSRHWRIPRTPAEEYSVNRSNQIEEFQIIVDKEGIYKISYEYLINQLDEYFLNNELNNELAFNWDDIDPRYLELTCEDNVVPIHFSGESDGSFDPGDYFEFYGQRHSGDACYYDDYTAENVYNLRLNNYLGSRMAVENGGLEENNSSNFYIPDSFQETVYFEEQLTMDHLGAQFVYTSNDYYREDIWFWRKISAPNLEVITFDLEYPHESNIRTYSAKISLFGLTYNRSDYQAINHHAIVRINNSIINNLEWYGQNEQVFQNQSPLPNSYLHHGENILYVSLPGVPGVTNEQVALDYLELTYWRRYMTDRDEFRFSKPQNRPNGLYQFELENFTTDQVFVYKLGASFMENLQIEPFSETGGAPYKVSFQDNVISNEIEYYVVSEEMKKLPILIRPNLPSSLKDPLNKAELVILTTEEFINSEGVAKYNEIWESQGYHVITVSAEDVYDEFNYGIRSAEAIKDFIAYAYHNWSNPLISHVLLLGDGILDERDFSVDRKYNIIPFRRIWADRIGAIASDNWFACFIGDDPVPDISISRITNWNESQILDCANKSESYLNNPNYQNLWHSHVILSAGGNPSEGSFFAKQCERIKDKWVPEDYHVTRVYCNTTDLPQSYYGNTTKLITNINKGALYLSFMGHGGGQVWADYNLLNMADIRTLNNQNYPFVSSLSCYASAFNYPQSACIGEELILVADKGAIGQVGFTGYGYLYADEIFGNYLTEAIFTKQLNSVGEIVSFTKAKFYGSYGLSSIGIALTQGCALLGDPMIRLTPPHTEKPVLLSQYNLAVGDTLVISSPVGPDITRGKFLIYDENDSQLPLDQYYPFEMPVINDTLWSTDFIVPQTADDIYTRKVKVFAFGDTLEVTGITEFTVGMSAAANIQIIPGIPTQADTIHFQADFFDLEGIESVECVVLYESTLPMNNIGGNTYRTVQPLSPMSTGTYVEYYFNVYDQEGDSTATEIRNFTVAGPDLFLQGFELTAQNYQPVVKTKIQNIGSQESGECILKLYDIMTTQTLISEITVAPLAIMEERWEYLPIPLLTGDYKFKLFANENQQAFTEYFYPSNNQVYTDLYTINMFEAGLELVNSSSIDGNFECMFPVNLLSENAVFYLNRIPYLTPLNQPDISTITLADSSQSGSYEINLLNQDLLADSLGHYPAGKRVMLSFNYSSQDSLIQLWENNGTFAVYRYQENYNKWVFQGGEIYPEEDKVNYFADKTGIYTILINNDDTPPQIEANVEGQEFTNGGYVSKNGVISFLLSDENGIDVFNNTIYLEVDGIIIPASDYSISLAEGNLISVPVKFDIGQLDLDDGEHYLTISCTDINGKYNSLDITFEVSTKFDLIRLSNYPNPVVSKTISSENEGRTRFIYILTDDADEVYMKIYTVSGRLVKTFRNLPTGVGYHEFPRTVLGWDCRDENGIYLANGIYFYRMTAKKDGRKIEKTQKMAILK